MQGVVVPVAAVAERAGVEHQPPLVGEGGAPLAPAAALHHVPAHGNDTFRSAGGVPVAARGGGPAQLGQPEEPVGEQEQVRVVLLVGVRQGGDRAVGTVQVEGDAAGQPEPVVVAVGHGEPEAAGVLTRAEERPQGHVVVVRRALAVDAVGPHVLEQVAVQLRPGQVPELARRVDRGQRQRRDEAGRTARACGGCARG